MKTLYLFVFAFLHLTVAVCCLVVTISIALLEGKFTTSQCGLYIKKESQSGTKFTYISSTPYSTCQFLKAIPGIVFVISLLLMFYHLYPAFIMLRGQQPRYQVWTVVCWCIMIAIGIFLFIASCIISVGFYQSCKEIETVRDEYKNFSCKVIFGTIVFDKTEKGDSIYSLLRTAEATSWVSCLGSALCIGISSCLIFLRRCQERPSDRSTSRLSTAGSPDNSARGHI